MKTDITLKSKSLQAVLELAFDHDLYDVSRYEGSYPALKEVCEALDEAGLGDVKLDGGLMTTKPNDFLKYVEENMPQHLRTS